MAGLPCRAKLEQVATPNGFALGGLVEMHMGMIAGVAALLAAGVPATVLAAKRAPPKPVVVCSAGCPRPSKVELPAPDISAGSPETILSLLRWFASQRDLSHADKVLSGLHQPRAPDAQYSDAGGRRQLNFTTYLERAPLIAGSPIRLSYTVYDPQGYAANQDSPWRTRVQIGLELDTKRLCIRRSWMERHFGLTIVAGTVTDGGGSAPMWDIGVWKEWHVHALAHFGPQDDSCTDEIFLSQTDHPL